MNYRKFGNLDIEISALGFGAMRLPVSNNNDLSTVDEKTSIEMMHYAFDHGVNYIDTAYPYHEGVSEVVVGKALKEWQGDKIHLATKMPTWAIETAEDFDKYLAEQMERLNVECVDFYLLHYLHTGVWEKVRDLGILEWCDRMVKEGKIKHFGFSFHDSCDVLKDIVDSYDWEFCQVQYNYLNENVQGGTKGVKYCAEKDMGIIIMEPLMGGSLAELAKPAMKTYEESGCTSTPVELALNWLWNKPEVSFLLSGMSTMDQVVQNVEYASRDSVGSLTDCEAELIKAITEQYKTLKPVPCTKCGYCMPCPHGVDIPCNFEFYNDQAGRHLNTRMLYWNLYNALEEQKKAAACTACRECEEKCPQQITISEWMPKVEKHFSVKPE